jgi:ribose transport system permease protein
MMSVARGVAKLVGKNQEINVHLEGTWLEALTLSGDLFFAPSVWLLLILAVIVAWILRSTVFGRQVFAVGSNEEAARLCGVRVEHSKVLIYSLAGLFTGMAGVFYLSRLAQGSPTEAVGHELDVIAAVVIGGGSLSGGEGSIFGSLAGALIMVVLRDGLKAIGAGNAWQDILIGAIIIVAVLADQLQRRKER